MNWNAGKTRDGYGLIKVGGKHVVAHRMAYELLVGPIPEGMEIDHVKARGCLSRSCCNPDHLEPVTHAENVRRSDSPFFNGTYFGRKTHCPKGHQYTEENTFRYNGSRRCKECIRAYNRKLYRRKKGLDEPRA